MSSSRSRKRTIDQVVNVDEKEDEPPLKKRKIEPDAVSSSISYLKQLRNRQRINSFCGEIVDIMQNVLMQDEHYKMNVPKEIFYEIVSFSEHKHVQQFWVSTEKRLKTFSFMINSPHSLEEIIEFEQMYRQKTKDNDYQIPCALRVSLLFARSIEMPDIFEHLNIRSYDSFIPSLYFFEAVILPLNQWKFVSETGGSEFYRYEKDADIAESSFIKWFEPNSDKYSKTLWIGTKAGYKWFADIFMNDGEIMFCCSHFQNGVKFGKLDICDSSWTKQAQTDDWYRFSDVEQECVWAWRIHRWGNKK